MHILDLIFPPRCITCSKPGRESLCSECSGQIKYLKPPICRICGKPKDGYFIKDLCEDCASNKPPYCRARSVALYEGVLKEAIHHFKFNGKRSLSGQLGQLLVDHLSCQEIPLNDIDIVIPIPLSQQRERERGYNQSTLLADVISKAFSIQMDDISLNKIKNIRPQFELKREERFTNIKSAFNASHIKEGKVLLVDDIFTTGATVSEAAKALREAGAADVYVLTLARAVE